MKIRFCFIAVLLISTSSILGMQNFSLFPGAGVPGPGAHPGNIFSPYTPASTYVGIFPGYRQGVGFRRYHSGYSGSAFEQMGRERDYYQGGYNFYRGGYWNSPPLYFQMWNTGWGYGRYPRESLYSSKNFVEQWKDRPPEKAAGEAMDLDDSPILSPGMAEEEVVMLLGTPLKRVTFEAREVWEYSSFSLVFENGILIEMR